ncbi:MAG: hypothetical protein JRF60_08560 [Deltaproteobacteria bacterium]|nr:hypothetical protein [Deltaproteobacteria bacterium]
MNSTVDNNNSGLKCNAECIFTVIVADMNMPRPCNGMFKLIKKGIDFFKYDNSFNQVTKNTVAFIKTGIVVIYS